MIEVLKPKTWLRRSAYLAFTGATILSACSEGPKYTAEQHQANLINAISARAVKDYIGKPPFEKFRLSYLDSDSYVVSDGDTNARAKNGDDCLLPTPYRQLAQFSFSETADGILTVVATDPTLRVNGVKDLRFREEPGAILVPDDSVTQQLFVAHDCIQGPHTLPKTSSTTTAPPK